jgi:DNA-binding GntR family transcriptional regulator
MLGLVTPKYKVVADALRVRLAAKEWQIGEQIPGISELQEVYDVPSLNTIRQAQQILIAEGLLRAEQGRGVFVVAHPDMIAIPEPERTVGALAVIDQAMGLLNTARAALTAGDV